VVLGSTHRGPAGRVLVGSVGEALLSGAPCAVAVAPRSWRPSEERPLRWIGAAINGSEDAWPALHGAVDLARRVGGGLRLFAAVEPMTFGYTASIVSALTGESVEEFAREEMERVLRRGSEQLPGDLEVETRLLLGRPSRALVEAAEDVNLLMLGSRGYGPLRRVLLGGVSSVLIRRSPTPVVVLPRGAGERPFDGAPSGPQ